MALTPACTIGLWNAWLLNLPELVFWSVGSRLLQRRAVPLMTSHREKHDHALLPLLTGMILGSYAYSLFLPLAPSSRWFSVGLALYMAGVMLESLALHAFAVTPGDKPVTSGIYSMSRNPMYLAEFLKRSGTGLACVSWLYTALAIVEGLLWHRLVLLEERDCLEAFGAAYQAYRTRVPRWVGRPLRKGTTPRGRRQE